MAFIPEFGIALFAAEASGMEDQIVGNQSLHRIDGLLTGFARFLFHLKAERLSTNADSTHFKCIISRSPSIYRQGHRPLLEVATRGQCSAQIHHRVAPVSTS